MNLNAADSAAIKAYAQRVRVSADSLPPQHFQGMVLAVRAAVRVALTQAAEAWESDRWVNTLGTTPDAFLRDLAEQIPQSDAIEAARFTEETGG